MVFVVSRNLWVAAANHATWNFTIVLTGVPLSGLEDWLRLAPFASVYRGPDWLTGGQFGPEASVVTMVLLTAAAVAMWTLAGAKGRLARATSPRTTETQTLTEKGTHTINSP
jgi:hypothetical protein